MYSCFAANVPNPYRMNLRVIHVEVSVIGTYAVTVWTQKSRPDIGSETRKAID